MEKSKAKSLSKWDKKKQNVDWEGLDKEIENANGIKEKYDTHIKEIKSIQEEMKKWDAENNNNLNETLSKELKTFDARQIDRYIKLLKNYKSNQKLDDIRGAKAESAKEKLFNQMDDGFMGYSTWQSFLNQHLRNIDQTWAEEFKNDDVKSYVDHINDPRLVCGMGNRACSPLNLMAGDLVSIYNEKAGELKKKEKAAIRGFIGELVRDEKMLKSLLEKLNDKKVLCFLVPFTQ